MNLQADRVPAPRSLGTRPTLVSPGPAPPVSMTTPLDAALHLARQRDGRWQLRSTRAEWAAEMLRGRPAGHAVMLLPGLYALCGGAHRLAARHALAAARGPATAMCEASPGTAADAQALRLDTLREHLRRLWLDAPRFAAAGGGATAAPVALDLAAAPFMHAGTDLGDAATETATRRWVETHVLHGDADAWLAAWEVDAPTHATRWAATAATWPAHWLGIVEGLLGDQAAPCRPLRAAASKAGLQALADALQAQPGFALAPTEDGQPAETGCWTRFAEPGPAAAATRKPSTASSISPRPATHAPLPAPMPLWLRHAARIAEIARLVAHDGASWLAQGRFTPAPNSLPPHAPTPAGAGITLSASDFASEASTARLRAGLGWCEMARGLLVHWVRLDADDRIAAYRVLAPTEWNFHPAGSAAQALAACAGADPSTGVDMAQVLAAAAAYDPCVELRLEGRPQEPADA